MSARKSGLLWAAAALGALLAFNFFFTPHFFQVEVKDGRLYGNLIDVLHRGAPVLLLALGMTLVIATGGVDLSVGAVMAMAGATAAVAVSKGNPAGIAMALALGVAVIAGLMNGLLVAWLGIQPIVATLILMVAGRGVAQLMTDGQIVPIDNATFDFLGSGYFCGFPTAVSFAVLAYVLAHLLTRRTALGLFLETTGDNPVASRIAGVRVGAVRMAAYVICSLCAGAAGILAAADIKAADANHAGLYLELDAILAVVIGGTALTGGRFSLVGSLLGGLLMQALTTTILARGVAVEFTLVVKAVVILAVCLLQSPEFREGIRGRFLGSRAL